MMPFIVTVTNLDLSEESFHFESRDIAVAKLTALMANDPNLAFAGEETSVQHTPAARIEQTRLNLEQRALGEPGYRPPTDDLLGALLGAQRAPKPDVARGLETLRQHTDRMVASLTDREREVLNERFKSKPKIDHEQEARIEGFHRFLEANTLKLHPTEATVIWRKGVTDAIGKLFGAHASGVPLTIEKAMELLHILLEHPPENLK